MTIDEIKQVQTQERPRFSVFARDKLPMPGVKKRLDEILNREILITDFRVTNSKQQQNRHCLQLQFVLDDEVCVCFTGSSVLLNQIQEAKDNIPFHTIVVKIDRYYSLS
ncbi:MAG: hypothetical protein MJ170_01520 [Alphaproteobacteria bacterium]|nr:hypothetical protein [Alphaproteobacteria bacterium]